MPTWRPDTCGCVIALDKETGEPIEALSACPRHANKGGAHIFVASQNREKNKAVGVVAAELGKKPNEIEVFLDNDEVEIIVDEVDRDKAKAALAKAGGNAKIHTIRPFRG